MSGFSWRRFIAVLRKEWIQVRRDPFTLRMIVALPVMQLFLFGYAINADPKHLPTGLLSANHSKYERTILAALHNTGYYDIRPLASEAAAEHALAQGEVLFVINIAPDFDRQVDRGEKPEVLMDADATDPATVGNATAALAAIRKALARYSFEFLLERTGLFAQAKADTPIQYIPNPTTFFSEERFNDNPVTWRRDSKPQGNSVSRNVPLRQFQSTDYNQPVNNL